MPVLSILVCKFLWNLPLPSKFIVTNLLQGTIFSYQKFQNNEKKKRVARKTFLNQICDHVISLLLQWP